MPYEMGLRLGAVWERQRLSVPLGGNLARFEARALVLTANIDRFPIAELAFCVDTRQECSINFRTYEFFLAFDVCFYRTELAFEVSPK